MQTMFKDGSVLICGPLPKDAEYKTVGDKNSSLTKFGVKIGERPVEGQDKPEAIWVNCDCWHEVAKAAKNFKKLDVVLCVGKINVQEYDKDGEKKQSKTLVCEFVVPMQKVVESVGAQASDVSLPDNFEEILDDNGVPF